MSETIGYTDQFLRLPSKEILVLGDIMLDRYFFGEVTRISPEAPVPVVHIRRRHETLGGAANVANNLSRLGCRVCIAGRVGDDPDGETAARLLGKAQIDHTGLIGELPQTISKTRIVSQNQQMLRLDVEDTAPLSPEGEKQIRSWLDAHIAGASCLIISDYAKGFCTPALCRYAIGLCRRHSVLAIVDPKGSDWEKYSGAFLVTPNLKELSVVCGAPVPNTDTSVEKAAPAVRERYGIDNLLVTRSEKGMTLVAEGKTAHVKARPLEVYDVSGAGDTVVSALSAMLAIGIPLMEAVQIANLAAGIAIAHPGTYAVSKEEILSRLNNDDFSQKIVDRASLSLLVESLRDDGKKVVFTNGCFDVLHKGHLVYLKKAKDLGDVLIIGVNSDESVKRLKGPDRPINQERDRALLLSAFDFVDYVTVFGEDTPLELISSVRPDILVKGGDYRADQVVGREYAGETRILPFVDGYSSTKVINAMHGGGHR